MYDVDRYGRFDPEREEGFTTVEAFTQEEDIVLHTPELRIIYASSLPEANGRPENSYTIDGGRENTLYREILSQMDDNWTKVEGSVPYALLKRVQAEALARHIADEKLQSAGGHDRSLEKLASVAKVQHMVSLEDVLQIARKGTVANVTEHCGC